MSINLVADVNDLKTNLQWGQPAFTIIDVRDRSTYNHSRITGAISIPLND
jgi:rhodanese-related sulfurtransferase